MNLLVRQIGLALLVVGLSACSGDNTAVSPVSVKKALVTGFSGNTSYEGEGGEGVGDGADGEGGIGAGGSLDRFRGVEAVVFLESGEEFGRAMVDDVSGMVTIYPMADYTGSLLIEIRGQAGGQYFDEAKNSYVDFGPGEVLRARADHPNRNIGITPLADAAAAYFDANPAAGGSTAVERIKSANELIAAKFSEQLPAAYKLTKILRLPTLIDPASGANAAPNTPAGTYAIVIAALSEMASTFNPRLDGIVRLTQSC